MRELTVYRTIYRDKYSLPSFCHPYDKQHNEHVRQFHILMHCHMQMLTPSLL